jgi:hypothetical protein
MPEAELLTIFAELALGVAGFSGVIVAIGPKQHAWHILDKLRVGSLLVLVIQVVVCALLPLGLYSAKIDTPQIWLFSSLLLFLTSAQWPFRMRLILKSAKSYRGFKSPTIFFVLNSMEAIAIVVLILNIFVFQDAWPHVLALGVLLTIAFLTFFELLMISMQNPDASA